jgi:hypothetical protein
MANFTLGQLKAQTYSRLEDNREMYQESEVTSAINEAISVINLACGWFQNTYHVSTTTTVADRHIYDFPPEIIFPQRVVFENQVLEKATLWTLGNNFPTFLRDTTATTGNQVSRWCAIGIRKFVIHPADSVGGGDLYVTGITEPGVLVEDADSLILPKEGIPAICDYAAHIVQCKLQGTPFMQSLTMFNNYQQMVEMSKFFSGYNQPTYRYDEQSAMRP